MSFLCRKMVSGLLIYVALFFLNSVIAHASEVLFKNKMTTYRIIVSPEASVTEKTAAEELKFYLNKISGADFKLSSSPGLGNIYVGYEKNYAIYHGINPYRDDYEGFTIKKINHDLVIYGGKERGTMFGVYRFLQEFFGVRWYTPDFTKAPPRKSYILNDIFLSEKPRIKYRYTDFFCAQNIPWLAHNTMNTISNNKDNAYGISSRYWGTHTMGRLLPADKYFKSHPEYFAYRNFHRINNGQLCLSNPSVLRIITKEIMSVIERYPKHLFYDVSQNDNQGYCTCKSCVKLEKKYGGHSGLMIWFVNQVARKVKKKYPNKYIGTFAYQYTRNAPSNIKPEDNVVVRLCDIECCFAHSLSSGCDEKNSAFMKDLKDWSKLTNNLYIWDYIVNYSNYMVPFPNIQVLGPNLKTFSEYGAIEVFEEAQSATLGNAFEELKCWVVAQLMWNPEQDTHNLVSQFVNDYYESSAKDIMDYYELCLSLIGKRTYLSCFSNPTKAPYTDEFIDKAYNILNRALKHAGNEVVFERVQKVMLQPMALECARHPQEFYKRGKWPSFKKQLLKYKSYFESGVNAEKFINSFESKIK